MPSPHSPLHPAEPALDALIHLAILAFMKTASVTESKNGLSGLLRHVKAGKSVLIFDRNVPVARLEPVTPGSLPDDQRLLALERKGLIRRPREAGSIAKWLATLPMPKMRQKGAYTNPVVAERNEDTR